MKKYNSRIFFQKHYQTLPIVEK